eukprot:CAMPEP_0178807154 /NCGR_PEP_ID=MMETSP0745-20121128/16764_1 /TAXON_ID=913974 /ORGANISM="Nitzschia punctata, Strain CCMP561" /LENGTH=1120 /DNA_ID=CAMNT_0020467107 /DNA_START=31 /DNA_END=3391 /DNA_ORIENTATION=-
MVKKDPDHIYPSTHHLSNGIKKQGFILVAVLILSIMHGGTAQHQRRPSKLSRNASFNGRGNAKLINYEDEETKDKNSVSCRDVYLAPSTIPDAGWGVFAARDFQVGERIGTPSVGIPFLDMSKEEQQRYNTAKYGALQEYLWEAANIGGFGEADDVKLFLPGIASLINHHPTLMNVVPGGLKLDTQEANTTIMAGSSSAYHGFQMIASTFVFAGQELFLDYNGEQSAKHPLLPSSRVLDGMPRADDYHEAEKIVNALWLLHEKQAHNFQQSFTPAQWIDLLHRIRTEILVHERREWIGSLLPRTFEELESAYEQGVARYRLREATPPPPFDSKFCLDNMRQGVSAVPDSGRGAVSTKPFAKGQVISVAPLVYVEDRSSAMGLSPKNNALNATTQLLESYCFGHRHASLLLCPTTHAALINHASSTNGEDPRIEPNVQIRWASPDIWPFSNMIDELSGNLHRPEDHVLRAKESDIASFQSTRVAFEYVAIRDIQEGEEILLDFGQEYENALREHFDKMEDSFEVSALKEQRQQKKLGQQPHLELTPDEAVQQYSYECKLYPNIPHGSSDWEECSTDSMMNQDNWPQEFNAIYASNEFAAWYPCHVVDSSTGTSDSIHMLYHVEVFSKGSDSSQVTRRLKNCPAERIRLVDKPYQSDQHLPWAFRRYIPLSDDIFPFQWRDDYKPASYWELGKDPKPNVDFDYEKTLREVSCGLYLAESNIPNAGFGLYTGIDIPSENVELASNMISVVINFSQELLKSLAMSDYVWSGRLFDFLNDGHPDFISEFSVPLHGVSVHVPMDILDTPCLQPILVLLFLCKLLKALLNFHTGLVNVDINPSSFNPVLDRRVDPGAGSFSDFSDTSFKSLSAIGAGDELFIDYGEFWLKQRGFNGVPLHKNFKQADQIVESVWSLLNLDGASLQVNSVQSLLQTIHDHFVDENGTKSLLKNIQTLDSLNKVIARGGSARATVIPRTQEWLDTNGYCLDHLYIKNSTISGIGKGAYSRRHLKKGSVIHSSPVTIAPRALLEMEYTKSPQINSKQLTVNYHFGHKDSSVLFYPLTQATSINHGSERTGELPNARIEFSRRHAKTRYMLSRPLEDVVLEKYSPLMLDVVATRDIEPDEE